MEGVISVTVGFLAVTVYYAWLNASAIDATTATIITLLSLIYMVTLDFNCPAVIVFGGALFIIRYLALWYYRHLDPFIIGYHDT